MEELAIMKARYEDSEVPDKLGIESWSFEDAMPRSDIIWSELNQGQALNTFSRFLLSTLIPFLLSLGLTLALLYLDQEIAHQIDIPNELTIAFKYLIPIAVFLISVFVMPKFLFKVALKAEGHERKSHKEESYVLKNMFYMVCNTLLAPISACCFFAAVHYNYDKANPAEGANKYPDKVPAPVVGF